MLAFLREVKMNFNIVYIIAELRETIISGLFVVGSFLLGAWLAYKYGLQTYFKQQEHEQIIKRYLEKGIDRVSEGVAQALRVFIDNNLIARSILIQLQTDRKADLPVNFSRYERQYLELTAFYKIRYLVGDEIFLKAIHSLFSFVDTDSIFLNTEFRSFGAGIPKAGIDKEQRLEHLKEIEHLLDEAFDKSENYSFILSELQLIASILEKETSLGWAGLSQFKNRPDIRESVKRAKRKFAELKKPKDEQKQ